MRDPEFHDRADLPLRIREGEEKPRSNVWVRLSRVMEGVIYLLLVLVVFRLFGPEWQRQTELQAEVERLGGLEVVTHERVLRLRQEHRLLKTDKDFLETVARDRLGLQREGEYVIRIERDGEDRPSLGASPSAP